MPLRILSAAFASSKLALISFLHIVVARSDSANVDILYCARFFRFRKISTGLWPPNTSTSSSQSPNAASCGPSSFFACIVHHT